MDPTPSESLNTYFAVQVLSSENTHAVAGAICKAAHEANTLFRRLEVLDTIQVAAKTFVRCRSDVANPTPTLDKLFQEGRGIVQMGPGGVYTARFPDGRKGPISSIQIHSIIRPGCHQMYRGPKVKNWERAFITS